MSARDDLVDIEGCTAIKDTGAAILVKVEGAHEYWIPKSQIDGESEIQDDGDTGILRIPRWLAEAKELTCD